MRVISRRRLRDFWERAGRGDAEQPLKAWHKEARDSDWTNPMDVKTQHRTASVLKNGRVVFNVGGNKYRLVAAIWYARRIVFVRFVGTHQEYDRIDAETV